MFRRSLRFILLVLWLGQGNILSAQLSLPRSTPEAEGVSAAQIARFLDAAAQSKCEFHSYMMLRHGKVIAEGWWSPYQPELKHTLYSCSKSFTATAIGFAVQENLLSLTDKVISFFPDELPDTVSSYLQDLSVEHLLTMSTGQDPEPTFSITPRDSNWVRAFLATPLVNRPGTRFRYSSMATYMLAAILDRVARQPLIEYLRPRLFEPLGIRDMDWEEDSRGIAVGGWGLRIKTEDMARFAQFFLQKGNWNGKQLLDSGWVEAASSAQILQNPNAPQSTSDSSDWLQGYGYQMWRCRHNAYRGDGAFGQFMIVIPDYDAVVVITAEAPDMQEEINLVWDHLLPAFQDAPLPENREALASLRVTEKSLALPAPEDNGIARKIRQKFYFEGNDRRWEAIRFNLGKQRGTVQFQTADGVYEIGFKRGAWKEGKTRRPGPSVLAAAIENTSMLYPTRVVASYTWQDEQTLKLVLRYIESPHTETLLCRFDGDALTVAVTHSFVTQKPLFVVKGESGK